MKDDHRSCERIVYDRFHIHQGTCLRKYGKNLISYILESFLQKTRNTQESKMKDLPQYGSNLTCWAIGRD